MLQLTEQRSPAAPVEFLIEFVRCLIRQHPSADLLHLSLLGAKSKVPITPEQELRFLKAITAEVGQSPWPKGFFS